MSKNKLDFNGLETLITMIKDFVVKKINNEISDIKDYMGGKLNDEVTRADNKYLPFSGGTLTGAINTANNVWNKLGDDSSIGDHNIAGKTCIKGLNSTPGIAFYNSSDTAVGTLEVNNLFNFNKTIQQSGKNVDVINTKGSNYIRYESGLQICWGFINISMSGAQSTGWSNSYWLYRKIGQAFTLPVSFTGSPVGFASVQDSFNYWGAAVTSVSSTTVYFTIVGDNNTSTKSVMIGAIGFWK